ncbi:MAG: BtpA/SgcQ family protein [Tepidisphaerales bacterium]
MSLLPHVDVERPVIGMLHLMPLPGSPNYQGDRQAVIKRLLEDADALVAGGVHALLLENFGDVPFFADNVPPYVIAEMTAMAMRVRAAFDGVPLGINVLRNDAAAAMAIAASVGADFIRVNVLTGARLTDQGIVQGRAHDVLRLRDVVLEAQNIAVWADVEVKHSTALAPRDVGDEVEDMLLRGLADALIVSGSGTGKPTDPQKLAAVRAAADRTVRRKVPVLVGAGVTPESLPTLARYADGFIVGSSLKHHGFAAAPVDPSRVKALMDAWRLL